MVEARNSNDEAVSIRINGLSGQAYDERTERVGPYTFTWPSDQEDFFGVKRRQAQPRLDPTEVNFQASRSPQQAAGKSVVAARIQPVSHSLQPLSWFESGYLCGQWSDYDLSQVEVDQYEEFKRQFIGTFDDQNAMHEAALAVLMQLCLSDKDRQYSDDKMRTLAWMKIGFGGENPRTDFRAGGILSLLCLVYFRKYAEADYERMVVASQDQKNQFQWAILSINVTSYLMSYLHMNYDRSMAADHQRIMANRCEFKQFAYLNSQSKQIFFLIHQEILKYVFYRFQNEMKSNPQNGSLLDFTSWVKKAISDVVSPAIYYSDKAETGRAFLRELERRVSHYKPSE